MTSFLKNTWYVAGWSSELDSDTLLPRRILDQPVLLFRDESGAAKAIGNRCPHRFAPLHLGRHTGNAVECGYHGLQFGGDGRCVVNPYGPVTSGMRVPAYPLVERHTLLWIWMGDAAADPDMIPDSPQMMSDERLGLNSGHLIMDADYQLLNDNLMDLTHAMFLHRGVLSTDGMVDDYVIKVWQENNAVLCTNVCENVPPPKLWIPFLPPEATRVDFFTDLRWDVPSIVHLRVGSNRCGKGRGEDGGRWAQSMHMFTPETATRTHYFYGQARDFEVGNREVDLFYEQAGYKAFFLEDKPMIEAVQEMMGGEELMSLNPLLLKTDNAAVRVRRILTELISAERDNAIADGV